MSLGRDVDVKPPGSQSSSNRALGFKIWNWETRQNFRFPPITRVSHSKLKSKENSRI